MSNLIKAFALLIFLPILVSATEIRVAYNHVPPHSTDINEKPGGLAIEYFRVVAKEMGVTPKFIYMPLSRMIRSLYENEVDMIAMMTLGSLDQKRSKEPEQNYDYFYPGILVHKRVPLTKITSASELYKYTIGTKNNMPMIPFLDDKSLKIKYLSGDKTLERAIEMTNAGRIDMVWSNTLDELIYMSKENKLIKEFNPILLPEQPIPLGVLFSNQGAKKYKKSYDLINKKFLKDGRYKEIFKNIVQGISTHKLLKTK